MTTFVVLIPKTYILGHLITLYCPCTLCARHIACTERARAIVATQTPIHICFRSQHYKCSHLALFWKRLETIFEKNIRPTSNLQIVPECLQHQVPYHVLYMKKVTFSRKKITKHGQNVVKRGLNIIPALTRKSPVLAIFLHYEQQKHTKVPQSLFIFLYRRLENGQLKLVCG